MNKLRILELVGALLVIASTVSPLLGAADASTPLGIASAFIGMLVILLR